MNFSRKSILLAFSVLVFVILSVIYVQDHQKVVAADNPVNPLVGVWEIYQTKAHGKPYAASYNGRPFVSKGQNAFTLILDYKNDGTFKRTSRVGANETAQEGTWKLDGKELRQKVAQDPKEEVLYLRFDSPNQFTSVEVFENCSDPGLFARFIRVR